MTEAIIISIVSGVFTLAGVIVTTIASNHKRDVEQAKRDQKLDDRLANVEKKLDEHNGYAQKFGEVAISLTEMRKDIQYLKEDKKK